MKTTDTKILSYNQIGNNIIVKFQYINKLSVLNAEEAEQGLMQLIKNGEKSIVLDFSEIEFIDSAGFQALLSVHIDAKLHNVRFLIVNVNKDALELFKLVELNDVFDLRFNNYLDNGHQRKAS